MRCGERPLNRSSMCMAFLHRGKEANSCILSSYSAVPPATPFVMRFVLVLSALVLQQITWSQITLSGRVVDAKTQEVLAFVPVNIMGTQRSVMSDIDGRFTLQVASLPVRLRMSYVGYTPLEMDVQNAGPLFVRLTQSTAELSAVVVNAEDNPAHRIIRRAYANRKVNDALRNRSYRYTSYGKTTFDMVLDSAVTNDSTRMAALDTSTREAYEFSEQQHLLLIESATRKSFIPPASAREEVLAMRVSGLKDPSLLALAAQTETFSIYDPDINISQKSYLGPLGPSSTAKYRFVLEDTLYQGADSIYVISYKPRPRTKFNALKGLLYIHTDGYAVQNVTAEPVEREGVSVRFQQLHTRITGKWFPEQLNTFIYFDNATVNGLLITGTGRTYLKDIEVDAAVERKEVRGPEFIADRMELRRDDAYWNALRTDTLDRRDRKTYAVIDSIGDSLNLDAKLKWVNALTTGRLPIGPVDLLLARILNYNGYEGLRLGAGLATNDRVSRYVSLGGYFGYGFQDTNWKYGGDLTIKPIYGRDLHLRLSYENDVNETGGVAFAGYQRGLISSEGVRNFYMDRMDRMERFAAQALVRVSGSLKVWVGTERTQRINDLGYRYSERVGEGLTRLRNEFLIGAITGEIRWAFREKIARLPHREISLGTKYPVVHIQAMRAVKGLWDGEWDTWRVNAMVEKTFRIRLLGNLSVRVLGGMADPDAPMPFLYNLRGTNATSVSLLIAAENTFETMRPNEFMADRYATFHVRHAFGNLLFKKGKFRPAPVLLTSVAVGELQRPANHRGLSFRAMEHAYIESGLRIDRLWQSFGAGVFYRYGIYALPKVEDNFVFKVSSAIAF